MRIRYWLLRAALAVLLAVAASHGLSVFLRTKRLHTYLTTRLAETFGRPVEVSNFAFRLESGLRLDANLITVDEDPRFGHEYFLRAERLSASLRWRSLFRGRFEFGTLSFVRPSLNLVRSADGSWNLESWLPPPPGRKTKGEAPGLPPSIATPEMRAPAAPSNPARKDLAQTRLYRIEVDTGRVNFKRGTDKRPFALINVDGSLEQEGLGRWRIDLEAGLMRAGVIVQEPGTLRVRGYVGGTSAHLRPADLQFSWRDASLADALRLVGGQDYGVRGRMSFDLAARSQSPFTRQEQSDQEASWTFVATAQLADVHRWDLPQRPGNPAVNLSLEAELWPGEARLELKRCVLEAPGSNLHASGSVEWPRQFDTHLRLISAGLSLEDLLEWSRAFHPGLADDLAVEGAAGADLTISGWPPWIERGALAAEGARMQVAGLAEPITLGRVVLQFFPARAALFPVTIAFPAVAADKTTKRGTVLRVDAAASRRQVREGRGPWQFHLNLTGQTDRSQDLLALAAAWGQKIKPGWSIEGPATWRLRWLGSLQPFGARLEGSIDTNGLQVGAAFLNRPLQLARARIELWPGERRVTLFSAQACGAEWSGWLRSKDAVSQWEVSLLADRLDFGELDRCLGPRARKGLIDRLVQGSPWGKGKDAQSGTDPPGARTGISGLRARGRLRATLVVLTPLELRRLRGEVDLQGRDVRLTNAEAEFYGGTARGRLYASLSSPPEYGVKVQLERVNLAALAGASPLLAGRFAGTASGELVVTTSGVGREDLLKSLGGRGTLEFSEAEVRGLDLMESFRAGGRRPGLSEFRAATAEFTIGTGRVELSKLSLPGRGGHLEMSGEIGFSGALDLRVHVLAPAIAGSIPPPLSGVVGQSFRLTGPLSEPAIGRLEPATREPGGRVTRP